MNSTKNGSQEQTPQAVANASPQSETSSSDALTSRSPASRRLTEADKSKAVRDLLNGDTQPQNARTGVDGATHGGVADDPARGPADDDDDNLPSSRASAETDAGGDERDLSSPASTPPKSLREVADALGIDVAALYELEVPLQDGGTLKLGALKDAHQNKRDAEREIAERAASLDERESAIIQETRIWTELGAELAQTLKPQTRQALMDKLTQKQVQERTRLLTAMPELRDQTKFDAFREGVVETLGKYGFAPHEIVVGDHRQLLVVRDLMRAQQRLKALREFKPRSEPPNSGAKQGRGAQTTDTARMVQRARSGSDSDKTAAVGALLRGH